MDTVDAIYSRRSIRDFKPDELPHEELSALIEAAVQAPNGVNLQPWTFVAIDEPARLARWSKLAKAYEIASRENIASPLLEHLTSEAFNIFYNAPCLVVICATSPEPMAQKDCCLAAENLMLAAHDRGIGSCWIGFAEGWLNSAEGRAELGVSTSCTPVAPIILGRPRSTPPRPPRKAPEIRWIAKALTPA